MRQDRPGESAQRTRRLAAFLREQKPAILQTWADELARTARGRELSRPALLDHLPHLLDAIAGALEEGASLPEALGALPDRHALDRLDRGFDLRDVVHEYGVLRATLTTLLEQLDPARGGEAALHRVIDEAVAASVEEYTRARARTLTAVDRLSIAALESGDPRHFPGKLLQVLLETTEDVDSAALLLLEDGQLQLAGSAGFTPARIPRALDSGFLARIARERRPAELSAAASDPALRELAGEGTRALYGVPLLLDGDLAGVVLMGSRSAYRFSDEDRLLLRTVAGRAMALIAQAHMLQREREARATLERRTAQLEAVLSSLPHAVYIGDAGGIRRLNRTALEQLGYSDPSELERPIGELARQILTRDATTGAQLTEAEQPFTRALHGEHVTREVLVRHLVTGEDRVVRSSAAPVRLGSEVAGAVAVNVDVTEQKRLERALRESEARLQSILDHAPACVYLKDREGRCLLANRTLQRMLGKPLEEILGRTNEELVGPVAAKNFAIADAEAWRAGQVVEAEEVLPTVEGDRTFMTVKFTIPGEDGQPVALCGISMDITDRKEAELAERRVAEVRDLFMGTLGHDLRNPLHAIRASAELLLRGDNLRPGQLRGVGRIIVSVRRAPLLT